MLFRFWSAIFAAIYGSEGLNVPLMFMPTKLVTAMLRRYGATIGTRVRFRAPLVIHNGATGTTAYYQNLSVGNDCYFGRELFLDLQDRIEIEDHVTISHRVMILTHTDAGTSPLKDTVIATTQSPVVIRRGAYVGANVTILEGVEIGEGAVIGAGAVVTHSVAAGTVAVGVPARPMRTTQAFERTKLHGVK
ncbi:MAG TPA: acyltransferase [Pyrinomonadaceae bacterium]|nr:acyltransferase [Pyrinomonadaceae bacterium]